MSFERIAKRLGITTCYWVGYTYTVPGGYCSGDLSITVRPWLTRETMGDVRAEIMRATDAEAPPVITFIHRIKHSS